MDKLKDEIVSVDLEAIDQAHTADVESTDSGNAISFVTGESIDKGFVAVRLDASTIQAFTIRKVGHVLPTKFKVGEDIYYVKSTGSISKKEKLTTGNIFAKEPERLIKPQWLN